MARGRKKIETVRWTGDVLASSTGLATAGTDSVSLYTVGDQEASPTILRTHFSFAAWLIGALGDGIGVQWALGIKIVPKGTGSTTLVSPLSEAEGDWFVHRTGVLSYSELVADAIQSSGMSGQRVEVDSKSMRKLKPGQQIQISVSQVTISGLTGASLRWACQPRFLLGT